MSRRPPNCPYTIKEKHKKWKQYSHKAPNEKRKKQQTVQSRLAPIQDLGFYWLAAGYGCKNSGALIGGSIGMCSVGLRFRRFPEIGGEVGTTRAIVQWDN